MSLHPAIGHNRWCGPAAVAILAGCDTDQAAADFRQLSGRKTIRRVKRGQTVTVLRGRGCLVEPLTVTPMTVLRFIERLAAGCYLLRVSGHLLATEVGEEGRYICDNLTIYPVLAVEYYKKRCRVTHAWRVTK